MTKMTRFVAIALAACLGACTAETVQLSDEDAGADAGDADTSTDGGEREYVSELGGPADPNAEIVLEE
jgi:hypothetical protein